MIIAIQVLLFPYMKHLTHMENKLRRFRKEKGLTLQEVADHCGLTKGYLSKIERATGYPPFPTLESLAKALDVELGQFFSEQNQENNGSPSAGNIELSNGAVGESIESNEGYAYNPLFRSYKNKYMSPFHMSIPKGRTAALSHDAEEFVYVLRGRVVLEYEGKSHALEPGGCFYLDSRLPHVFVNEDDEVAELLAVNFTYKRF